MDTNTCTRCGTPGLEPGFIEDTGQGSRGDATWTAGPLERGVFGGAERMGRQRRQIDAFRCRACGHPELFASEPM